MTQAKKILAAEPGPKKKLINFRVTEADWKAFKTKLTRERRKAQHFWDSILRAYLEGKIN